MAGRIRTIKPEFLEDEKLSSMRAGTRLLFAGLWLLADDHGNLRAAPSWIHGQVFHSDPDETPETVRESLATLSRAGMLTHYWVRGQGYYHVTNWHRHQRVDRPGKPRVPVPKEADSSGETEFSRESHETVTNDSGESRGSLATDPEQGTGNREQGTGKDRRVDTRPASDIDRVFGHWKQEHGHPRAKLDTKRRSRIQARLRDFSADQLCLAITNAHNDPWLMGEDPKAGRKYDGLETLLRDTTQVERLLEMTTKRLPALHRSASNATFDSVRRKAEEARAQEAAEAQRERLLT